MWLRYTEASALYGRAEQLLLLQQADGASKKALINVLIGMGLVEKKASRYEEAKALYRRALALEKNGTAKWAEVSKH